MCVMNWGAFDLNLLIVFDAVMQERSVTRAGRRIGLSQPAMSHALNRLRGLARHIALRAPYLSAAPILVQSDLVATLSRRIAQEFVRHHPLLLRKPPYESPRVRTVMLWHRRLDRHPAHRWLRDLILAVTKGL